MCSMGARVAAATGKAIGVFGFVELVSPGQFLRPPRPGELFDRSTAGDTTPADRLFCYGLRRMCQ
jgi:hypothetical protein